MAAKKVVNDEWGNLNISLWAITGWKMGKLIKNSTGGDIVAKNKDKKGKERKNTGDKKSSEPTSDVLGSYTGKPADGGQPVQDADDL